MSAPVATPTPAPAAPAPAPSISVRPTSIPSTAVHTIAQEVASSGAADDDWDYGNADDGKQPEVAARSGVPVDDVDDDEIAARATRDGEDWDYGDGRTNKPEAKQPKTPKQEAVESVQDLARTASAPAPESAKRGDAPAPATPAMRKVRLGKEEREIEPAKLARALRITDEELAALPGDLGERMFAQQWNAQQRTDAGVGAVQGLQGHYQKAHVNAREAVNDFLRAAGVDTTFDKLAEQRMVEHYEEAALDPKEKELRALRREREARDASDRARKAREEYEAEERARMEFGQLYAEEIVGALTDGGMPDDPYTYGTVKAYLDQEMTELGDSYERPRSRAEMRQRAARYVPKLVESDKAAVAREFKRLGPEKFAEEYADLNKALTAQRVAAFKAHQAAQFKRSQQSSDTNGRTPETRAPAPTAPPRSPYLRDYIRNMGRQQR